MSKYIKLFILFFTVSLFTLQAHKHSTIDTDSRYYNTMNDNDKYRIDGEGYSSDLYYSEKDPAMPKTETTTTIVRPPSKTEDAQQVDRFTRQRVIIGEPDEYYNYENEKQVNERQPIAEELRRPDDIDRQIVPTENETQSRALLNQKPKVYEEKVLVDGDQISTRSQNAKVKNTEIIMAAEAGQTKQAKRLLRNNIDPNVRDYTTGDTALIKAAGDNGGRRTMKALIDNQANINTLNNNGESALFIAAKNGNRREVDLLLDMGAKLNLTNKKGVTAIMVASLHRHQGVVKDLIRAGAKLNVQSENGYTALMYAAINGYDKVVRDLLLAGANPNLQAYDGNTALAFATYNGHERAVRELIGHVSNVVLANKDGNTAFMLAAARRDERVFNVYQRMHNRQLIRIDVNYQNNLGNTALMYAAYSGNYNIVKGLIAMGANVQMKNFNGVSALMLAYQEGHEEIVNYIKYGRRKVK